jgi:hypothetical protein
MSSQEHNSQICRSPQQVALLETYQIFYFSSFQMFSKSHIGYVIYRFANYPTEFPVCEYWSQKVQFGQLT